MTRTTRRGFLAGGAATIAAGLAGCSGDGAEPTTAGGTSTQQPTDWRRAELADVLGGETFTIAGLTGPVVLETFAVWCPTCTEQQRELATLADADLTRVSLNVDPNEDAGKVRDHAADHGFDWRYVVAPAAVTQSLVEEFGSGVTVAPSAPVVVVCEDGSATYLSDRGVKSADTLRSTAREC